jgi:hypothetical protein
VGKPEGKIPFGKPRHRWCNIKMAFNETRLEGVDWIYVVPGGVKRQTVLVTVMNIWASQDVGNFLFEGPSASAWWC